jgi:anti-anti-sigma factor
LRLLTSRNDRASTAGILGIAATISSRKPAGAGESFMKTSTSAIGGIPLIVVAGDLDQESKHAGLQLLDKLFRVPDPPRVLLLDLSDSAFIDSGGITVLLSILDRLPADGWLGFIGVASGPGRVLTYTGFLDHEKVRFFSSTDEAAVTLAAERGLARALDAGDSAVAQRAVDLMNRLGDTGYITLRDRVEALRNRSQVNPETWQSLRLVFVWSSKGLIVGHTGSGCATFASCLTRFRMAWELGIGDQLPGYVSACTESISKPTRDPDSYVGIPPPIRVKRKARRRSSSQGF